MAAQLAASEVPSASRPRSLGETQSNLLVLAQTWF